MKVSTPPERAQAASPDSPPNNFFSRFHAPPTWNQLKARALSGLMAADFSFGARIDRRARFYRQVGAEGQAAEWSMYGELVTYWQRTYLRRLRFYGLKPCPNLFCIEPVHRKSPTGPWPDECEGCRRTSERWRGRARRAAKLRPTRRAPVPEGIKLFAGQDGVVHCWMTAEDRKELDEALADSFELLDDTFAELMQSNGENFGAKRNTPHPEPDWKDSLTADSADVSQLPSLGAYGELATAWQYRMLAKVDEMFSKNVGTIAEHKRELQKLAGFGHFDNAIFTYWLEVTSGFTGHGYEALGGEKIPRIGSDQKSWTTMPRRREGKPFKRRPSDTGGIWGPGEMWLHGTKNPALTTRHPDQLRDAIGRPLEIPTRVAAILKACSNQEYERRGIASVSDTDRESPAYEQEGALGEELIAAGLSVEAGDLERERVTA